MNAITLIILFTLSKTTTQIYAPDEYERKPATNSLGIKTKLSRVEVDHNYSRVYHQNHNSYSSSSNSNQRLRPQHPIYVLNGTRIGQNSNPTRQIVTYNKEKRSPKIEIYKTCPKNATGQFVYEFSCNQFLNCWKGRGHIQNCAPGTLFNPKTLECDYPEKVYCVTGPRQSILQRSQKRVEQIGCPKEFSGLIPNYTDCSKFINCVSGIENFMECPPGTLFDVNKNICDFEHKATCFNGQNEKLVEGKIDGKLNFGGKVERSRLNYKQSEVRCPRGVQGLQKHPFDCSKFLNCDGGKTFVQNCGPGTLFNPVLKICDFPYNVKCEYGQSGTSGTEEEEITTTGYGYSEDNGGSYSSNGYHQGYDGYHSGTNRYQTQPGSDYYDGTTNQQTQYQGTYNQYSNPIYQRVPVSSGQDYGSTYNRTSQGLGYGSHQTPYQHYDSNYHGTSNQYDGNRNSGYYGSNRTYQGQGYYNRDRNLGYYDETGSNRSKYQGSSLDNTGSFNGTPESHGYYDSNYHGTSDQYDSNRNSGYYGSNRTYQGQGYHNRDRNVGYYDQTGSNRSKYQGSSSSLDRGTNFGYYDQTGSFNGTSEGHGYYDRDSQFSRGSGYYNNQGISSNRTRYHSGTPNHRGTNLETGSGYYPNSGSGYYGTKSSSNQFGTFSEPYRPNQNVYVDGTNQYPTGEPSMSQYPQYNPVPGDYNYNGNGFRPTVTDQYHPSTNHRYQQNWGTNQYQNQPSRTNSYENIPSNWNRPVSGAPVWKPVQQAEISNNGWNQNRLDQEPTPNYDQVVNINQRYTTVPFRKSYEPFFGPTTLKSNDYEDYHGGTKYVRSTTPRSKIWPPPFPSTDVNADYTFDYEDPEVDPEAESVVKHDGCGKNDFKCSSQKCVSKSLVCNGFKDCPGGEDELKCLENISKFSLKKNSKLAVLEKERWDNVSIATCALLCVESQKINCRSFNYRKIDKTCFLTTSNEALSGGLISYYPFDYYELITEKIDCTNKFICPNKKCIDKKKLCDGQDDCGDRLDEKNCNPQDFGYSLRLTGSKNRNEGLVEVSAFGKTGYVCDDKFGLRDANVVCKELGYNLGAVEVKGNSFFVKNVTREKPFYMMDDVTCVGNETRLMDCDFSGWGVHNCLGQEIVGVVCKTPYEKCASDYWQCDTGQECLPLAFVCDGLLDCTDGSDEGTQHCDAPVQIRLVNGTTHQEGRVEIRHHGIWGTICDDDFNEDAAKVVCRQLGYKGAAVVKKNAHYGPGQGPIWLDQVFCSGNETSIESCSHWNWGEHNCEHSEDVGVFCSNTFDYEERHLMVKPHRVTQIYPDRCGFRNDRIFDRGDDVHFRVVKGSIARRGDYPWQAALRVKGKTGTSHWCGAVVISPTFVLTAAHCLIGYSKGAYIVVAGDYNVDDNEGTEQESYIDDFYLHENFREGHKMNNDIALIKLKTPFRLNEDVQAICLPDSDVSYETEQNCTISGFGSIQSGKSAFSHNLRAGWIPLQKKEICTMPHVYGNALTDGMICAGSLDEGIDACDGDSGGPLACLNRGLFTLYGITSWGQHCGYANKPGVYVKVAHYRRWIDDKLNKYSKFTS